MVYVIRLNDSIWDETYIRFGLLAFNLRNQLRQLLQDEDFGCRSLTHNEKDIIVITPSISYQICKYKKLMTICLITDHFLYIHQNRPLI